MTPTNLKAIEELLTWADKEGRGTSSADFLSLHLHVLRAAPAIRELLAENERMRRGLENIEYGLTMPSDNVQRAVRDAARSALGLKEDV